MLSTKPAARRHALLELVGWLGVGSVVGAYLLNTMGLITAKDLLFLLMNGAGSIGIMTHAFHRKDYQSAVLNIIWLAIALIGLFYSIEGASAMHLH